MEAWFITEAGRERLAEIDASKPGTQRRTGTGGR